MTLMKSIFGSVLLLVFSSFICAGQDKSTAAIKGKVSVERGSPAGIGVTLMQGEQEVGHTATGKKGDFVLAHIVPGTYSVRFRKPGLAIGTIDDVLLKAGQTRSFKDLMLKIDEGSLTFIRGSVFSEDGHSVPGVRVDLARIINENSVEKMDSRITGETGEFVFRLTPDAGKYRLILKADGVEPSSKGVEVEQAAVYRVALTYKKKP
jgi:Carboxypeptidase regulatory-like domain